MADALKHDHTTMRPGFIGAGRMAQAIARGIATNHPNMASEIRFVDPLDASASAFLEMAPFAGRLPTIGELVEQSSLIVVAVKPQSIRPVLTELSESSLNQHLVVSVVAGLRIETIAQALDSPRIVRVMPNTPCLIGKGVSAISAPDDLDSADLAMVASLFESLGVTLQVPEYQMDAVTGLSGSGPAYVYTFIESLIEGGVLSGLARGTAEKLALQTVLGAAAMVETTGKGPAELRGQVTSPGGTTIAGLAHLERSAFRGAIMDAVAAATRRAAELGG